MKSTLGHAGYQRLGTTVSLIYSLLRDINKQPYTEKQFVYLSSRPQRVNAQLESDLIISFASSAVRNVSGTLRWRVRISNLSTPKEVTPTFFSYSTKSKQI